MARAIDLLSRREYTRRELELRLGPHATSSEELNDLLNRLAAGGLQSDQRYAEQFSRIKGRKYGSLRLQHAMREKGLDAESIGSALSQQDDLQTARQIWQRKFGTVAQTLEDKARQVRFLAARGFPSEVIRQVLAGAIDEDTYDT